MTGMTDPVARSLMKWRTILVPLCLGVLAACASVPPTGRAQVTGSVSYLQRVALPPGAVIKVQLVDVSRADAHAVVLGEQLIRADGRQPPFAFAVDYDPSKIQPNWSYAVSARIEDGGTLLFISDRRYAVLTRGAPAHADLVLRAVGAARP